MTAPRPRLLIVGGGPGGMAVAIWAARLGLEPTLLEARDRLGGQLLTVLSAITDYPGLPDVDGPALAARFVEHVCRIEMQVRLGCAVSGVDPGAGRLTTATGETLTADGIVVATGALRRRLGIADEDRLVGHGVSYSVSRDRGRAAGRAVVVVGGGDSAVEGAASLGRICPAVHLVHRSALSARPDFVAAAQAVPTVHLHPNRQVVELRGQDRLEAVGLDDGSVIACELLFVRIGVTPATAFVRDVLPCDGRGFLLVDEHQRCAGRVYAVGDVCSPDAMAVSVAAGQAMVACKHVQRRWRSGGRGPSA